jgi:hypothetical protein
VPGTAYLEFTSTFNNKYVIYPGDPVEGVIHAAPTRWEDDVRAPEPAVRIDKTLMCSPASHDQHDFVFMGWERSGKLSITVTEPGKYRVSIAPEGIGFDSHGADSCYFEIANSTP